MRSIDCVLLKGDVLVRKIFTMRNALEDSDGFKDPDTITVDEVPKTVQFTPTLEYYGQVINVDRILNETGPESNDQEESKDTEPGNSLDIDIQTGYKYAFGSRVKQDEDFDKGLGIVGMNKQTLNQQRVSSASNMSSAAGRKRTTAPAKMNAANKLTKKGPASKGAARPGEKKSTKTQPQKEEKPVKGILRNKEQDLERMKEELKQQQTAGMKKESTPLEIALNDQKVKLERELAAIAKEEQKLEMLRKRRQDLFDPKKKLIPKENDFPASKRQRKPKPRTEMDDLDDQMAFEDEQEDPSRMPSIQETRGEEDDEEEDFDHYRNGMRTGLSIEEDDHDDDFNRREATHAQYTDVLDDRDDIEDMVVAGTKTRIQHQTVEDDTYSRNKESSPLIDNDREEVDQEEVDQEETNFQDDSETIPIITNNNVTMFSVHNQDKTSNLPSTGAKFDAQDQSSPTETGNIEMSQYDNTTFSVKKVESNTDSNAEPELTPNNSSTQPEVEDHEIYEDIKQTDELDYKPSDRVYEEEDLEEGTFEDYEIGNDDLATTDPHASQKEHETKYFSPKKGLSDTEKYYLNRPQSNSKPVANKPNKPNQPGGGLEIFKNYVSKPHPSSKQPDGDSFNPFVDNSLAKVEGWTTTHQEEKYKDMEDEPDLNDSLDQQDDGGDADDGNKDEEVELVYNSVLGLYYDPKSKQHFEVKPEGK